MGSGGGCERPRGHGTACQVNLYGLGSYFTAEILGHMCDLRVSALLASRRALLRVIFKVYARCLDARARPCAHVGRTPRHRACVRPLSSVECAHLFTADGSQTSPPSTCHARQPPGSPPGPTCAPPDRRERPTPRPAPFLPTSAPSALKPAPAAPAHLAVCRVAAGGRTAAATLHTLPNPSPRAPAASHPTRAYAPDLKQVVQCGSSSRCMMEWHVG